MRAPARSTRSITMRLLGVAALAGLGIPLAACAGDQSAESGDSKTVTIAVHDSFPGDEFAAAASAATGYDVEVVTSGDGGELTNTLVLTQGAPIADAFFGVDNTFASRLIDHDVVEPFAPSDLPASAAEFVDALVAEGAESPEEGETDADTTAEIPMVPVDHGAVCVNIDTGWFGAEGLTPPSSYEDLADPRYAGLTVLIDPTASSTGAAFLIGTVEEFGEDGFADYWTRLVDNGVRIESGWSEAYNGQFTQGGGEGTYPVALSYATSPAFTVDDDGTASTTTALLDTCTDQVEYAGVLKGAANPDGAKAVVDYLLSREFQDTIAETMYMYPIDDGATVPEEWQKFAPAPEATHDLAPAVIDRGREGWLKTWSEATRD